MSRRTVVAVVMLAVLTGCAPATATQPASSGPSSTPAGGPALDADSAVYVAVLRRYLSTPSDNSFPGRTFTTIYVLDRAVTGAGSPDGRQRAGTPIPAATQRAIVDALSGVATITFVADQAAVVDQHDGCAVVRNDGILITLAPPVGTGDQRTVGVNGFVACLGATWLTYVVALDGSGWRVTGTTGPMAVA